MYSSAISVRSASAASRRTSSIHLRSPIRSMSPSRCPGTRRKDLMMSNPICARARCSSVGSGRSPELARKTSLSIATNSCGSSAITRCRVSGLSRWPSNGSSAYSRLATSNGGASSFCATLRSTSPR